MIYRLEAPGDADLVHYVSFLHYLVIERPLKLEDKID